MKSKILELNEKGYSQLEIAGIIGKDQSTISKILQSAGVASARIRGQRGAAKKMRADMEKNVMLVAECILRDPAVGVPFISNACNMSDDTVYRCLRYMEKYYYDSKNSCTGEEMEERMDNPIYFAAEKRLGTLRRLAYGHVISIMNGKYYKLAMNILRMPSIMEKIRRAAGCFGETQKMAVLGVEPKKMTHSAPNIAKTEIDAAGAEIAATAATRNERAGWAAVPGPAILELYLMVRQKNKGKYTEEEIKEVAERAVITAGVVNSELTVVEAVIPRDCKSQILELHFPEAREKYLKMPNVSAWRAARESFVYGKKALARKAKYATISQLIDFASKYQISYFKPHKLAAVYEAEGQVITRATAWGLINALSGKSTNVS